MTLSLFHRIEPTLGADEQTYRLHYFGADRTQAKVGALLVISLAVVVLAFELGSLPSSVVPTVVVARTLFIVIAIAALLFSRHLTAPQSLDRTALVFSMAFAAQFIVLLAVRPPSRVDDVGMIVLVLACYALSPAPLLYRTVAPMFLTIGAILVLWIVRDTELTALWPSALVMVAANALGLWGSARLHTQRRGQFLSQERLRLSLNERDALIERLRQSNKMESMGRIVGGVAHDFNNILGSMFAAVEFLLEDLPELSPSREDVESLKASVKRGADLTKQLLAFSRQQVLEPKVVDLNDLVDDTKRMLTRTIGEHIAIEVSPGDRLAAVRVDPGQVQQILLNLSVNARDAMPSGGSLRIQTRSTELVEPTVMSHSVAPRGPYILLAVSDTGSGIDAATLPKIFEPFFTTKPKGRGTGLGLSTVFGIVEQSGGHIRVRSEVGRGTTFEIFLPAVAELPEPVTLEPAVHAVSRGTETILVAEDDPSLRVLLGRVLTLNGYKVLEACDGADALRISDEFPGPVHLLASDVVMPIMGGQRLAQELTVKRPGVKVLFMSGYTEDAFTSGKLGPGDAFLQKPVDPAVLLQRVRSLLDSAAESRAALA